MLRIDYMDLGFIDFYFSFQRGSVGYNGLMKVKMQRALTSCLQLAVLFDYMWMWDSKTIFKVASTQRYSTSKRVSAGTPEAMGTD